MEPHPHQRPITVRLARGGGAVTLDWADRSARVTASTLRGACRCAWCTLARRRGQPVGDAEAITAFEPMGGEAVHIVFSDGHRTGVYPWDFLHDLATTEPTPPAITEPTLPATTEPTPAEAPATTEPTFMEAPATTEPGFTEAPATTEPTFTEAME